MIQSYVGGKSGRNPSNGLMFHQYMVDLGYYFNNQYGIVIFDEILFHLLWVDDLILFSDTTEGLQSLLNGLN